MGLEAETDLHNAPAKQNQADRTDEAEDKVAEVVDDGNGVACGKGGHTHETPFAENWNETLTRVLREISAKPK